MESPPEDEEIQNTFQGWSRETSPEDRDCDPPDLEAAFPSMILRYSKLIRKYGGSICHMGMASHSLWH